MPEFRDSRFGIRNASLILGVTVTELREAILSGTKIHGVIPPNPLFNAGQRKSEMMFKAGDILDCAEAIQALKTKGEAE
ncbi:MAG: hypothetical protein U5L98_15955 [Halomonas sp.]|uniref:hypothetical protein n=1 Tax=Halomonas sp. TaxID=1486246 RepID=UPI002ACEC09B|nr:hypothetical protein [Halomonas sp.]MDZ7854084.1 hypothetical protein [Halomonas sp.]